MRINIFFELRGLVLKTMGLADVLRAALASIAVQITQAFVFGSMAKQQNKVQSDMCLLIVSPSLGYADVFGALENASATLVRSINPAIYTPDDVTRRVAQNNAFISRVMRQPESWLIGQESRNHEPSP